MAKSNSKSSRNKVKNSNVLINDRSPFAIVESFKAIRTNLSFAVPNNAKCKKILFTSSFPAEGKTAVTANVGITIAQTDAKVLIIDADLRKPNIHTRFGLANSVGLSNLLSGMATIEEAITHNVKGNLDILTAGIIPPNPSELFATDNMKTLMRYAEENYDYVIVDTPPINVVADALDLSPLVDGVVLVVKYKFSTHPATREALDKLQFVGANIIGIIMNNVTADDKKYYKKNGYKYSGLSYRYNFGYGYKYGYGYNNSNRDSKYDTLDDSK